MTVPRPMPAAAAQTQAASLQAAQRTSTSLRAGALHPDSEGDLSQRLAAAAMEPESRSGTAALAATHQPVWGDSGERLRPTGVLAESVPRQSGQSRPPVSSGVTASAVAAARRALVAAAAALAQLDTSQGGGPTADARFAPSRSDVPLASNRGIGPKVAAIRRRTTDKPAIDAVGENGNETGGRVGEAEPGGTAGRSVAARGLGHSSFSAADADVLEARLQRLVVRLAEGEAPV